MNEINEQILARIRQLLAMAADTSSPSEASIAAGRARKLMDAHQITLDDLKESNGFGFARAGKSYRFMPVWKDILSIAVGVFNDCKVIAQHEWKVTNNSYSKHIVFQGFEADVACAVAMYEYLTAAIDRLCGVYIKELGYDRYPAMIGDAYKKGCSNEVCTRLRQMQEDRVRLLKGPAGTALVVFKMAEVEAEFGKFKTQTVSLVTKNQRGYEADQARARGSKDGRELPLTHQIEE